MLVENRKHELTVLCHASEAPKHHNPLRAQPLQADGMSGAEKGTAGIRRARLAKASVLDEPQDNIAVPVTSWYATVAPGSDVYGPAAASQVLGYLPTGIAAAYYKHGARAEL
jgi:hypothetical protein